MAVKGRLKNGDLLLAGEINERLPAIQDGLIAHFPFDGTTKGDNHAPILDYSIWKDGQIGSVGLFSIYSSAANNTRVSGLDPWGKPTVLWKCTGANAGIYCNPVPIDNTKLYRFTWWVNRAVNGNGRSYYGCNGYGSVAGVKNLSGTYNTNPYFWNSSQTPTQAELPTNEWVLFVAHIFPHTHTDTARHSDSGRYTKNGFLGDNNADYKWAPETTTARGRTLSIYQATDINIEHYHSYMRMEICDGTEPTINELLAGESNIIHPIQNVNTTLRSHGVAVEEDTTNVISNPHLFSSGWNHYSNGHSGSFMTEFGVEGLNLINKRSWCGATKPITLPVAGTYTLSVWVKPIARTNASIGINLYTSGGGISDTQVAADWSADKIGKWQKLTMTRTYTTTSITLFLICFGGSNAAGYEISAQYTMPQIELKPFATSFVNGTRSSGSLALSNVVPKTGDYTVHFTCKVNSAIGNAQSYNTIMSMGSYNTNNSWTIMDTGGTTVGGTLGFIRKGNAAEWAWATTSLTPSSDLGKELVITVTKDATNYKCYYNGVLKGTLAHVATTMQDFLWIGSREYGTVQDSTEFRNLSIYNRSLSETEILKLSKHAFSIHEEGELVTSKAIEKPNGIPSDAQYIPLGVDGMDEHHMVSAANDANSVYEDGNVFLNNIGTLNFNFYRDYGLDWSQNWSIVYWKKPIATNGGSLTGYNIESLGSNSNSVGGGYWWFGKPSGANYLKHSINPSISATFAPGNYFEQWHMVSITKSGSTITYSNRSETLSTFSSTFTTTIAANYFVTQHGYDFMFGWDAGNACHTHYKDLMIAKRALPVSELDAMHQTQMRAKPGQLQIRGQFKEGTTLV